jgi:hypothetical protein
MTDNTPWYKQFWPWFLISLPASAVVAGIATLFIALNQPFSMVADDYYKQGLAINQDRARQRRAEEQGLSGKFKLSVDAGTVSLSLSQTALEIDASELSLRLIHFTQASQDRAATLALDMRGNLSGLIKAPRSGRWQVIIEPLDRAWQLTGEFSVDERTEQVLVAVVPS